MGTMLEPVLQADLASRERVTQVISQTRAINAG